MRYFIFKTHTCPKRGKRINVYEVSQRENKTPTGVHGRKIKTLRGSHARSQRSCLLILFECRLFEMICRWEIHTILLNSFSWLCSRWGKRAPIFTSNNHQSWQLVGKWKTKSLLWALECARERVRRNRTVVALWHTQHEFIWEALFWYQCWIYFLDNSEFLFRLKLVIWERDPTAFLREKDSPIFLSSRLLALFLCWCCDGSLSLHGITSSIHSGVVSWCVNSSLHSVTV